MESRNILIEAWYDTQFQNEQQRSFMLDSSQLFELFAVDHSISGPNAAKEIRSRHPPEKLFDDALLRNNEMYKELRSQLTGMNRLPSPASEVRDNTRAPIKCAYILYPGDEFKELREKAIKLIENYYHTHRQQQTATKKTTITPNEPETTPDPDLSEMSILKESFKLMQQQLVKEQEDFTKQLAAINQQFLKTKHESQNIADIDMECKKPTRKSTADSQIVATIPETPTTNTILHHDIAQRFKDKENKFGGSDNEDLFEQFLTY